MKKGEKKGGEERRGESGEGNRGEKKDGEGWAREKEGGKGRELVSQPSAVGNLSPLGHPSPLRL